MATIKYFTRTSAKKDKLSPVYCRLRSGRDIDITVKSGIKVQPDQFNNKSGEIRQIAEAIDKDKINKNLRDLRNHIFNELSNVQDYTEKNSEWLTLTIDKFWFPEKYTDKVIDLFTFIQNFIDKAPIRINPKSGRPVCYKMIREYERTFHYLKEYSKFTGKKIDFKDIDLEFYYGFVEYLQSFDLATNTIGKKIQTLKIFLNVATDQGYNRFRHYKSPRFSSITEESQSIYLNQEELKAIFKLDLSDQPSLERVRDLFIVGCWTGVRFSDISQITPNSIDNGFISIKQSKTGGRVVIPVHDTVKAILDKYDGQLPPNITNQKFNEYLKKIAKKVKLNEEIHITITKGGVKRSKAYKKHELVTTHTGRRSFATNNYLMGVPSLDIMAITGHKTESSFLRYIKVTPKEHAERIRTIWKDQVKLEVI